jgi:hypothetical protein
MFPRSSIAALHESACSSGERDFEVDIVVNKGGHNAHANSGGRFDTLAYKRSTCDLHVSYFARTNRYEPSVTGVYLSIIREGMHTVRRTKAQKKHRY